MDGNNKQTNLHTDKRRRSVPVYGNVLRSWFTKSHDHPKGNRSDKRNRHYKHLLAISGICLGLHPINAFAEGIGGVSATASPIANSSGSVTNQAIQVLQGPYITNTYGGGIQCQGPTRNFTPFLTGNASWTKPYEGYYNSPVYDMRDLDDDGAPDNPGDILYHVPTRTGQKDNYSLSAGFSMTWSTPLDKDLQEQCKQAAEANIAYMIQNTANKRLDFELARLKNCGEMKKAGIMFHPKSPYFSVCADVMLVQPAGVVVPHMHSLGTNEIKEPPKKVEANGTAEDLKTISIGNTKD